MYRTLSFTSRRAFPGFDEPVLEATFQLTLQNIPARMICLSNTPMASKQSFVVVVGRSTSSNSSSSKNKGEEFYHVTFQTTPRMSTYLLAFIVGELDGISKTVDRVVTTVYTVPGKAEQGRFCLDTAAHCLQTLQDLFQIPYPLTKSDLVAVPDFAAGAMEGAMEN
jgi:aminopeptidase N